MRGGGRWAIGAGGVVVGLVGGGALVAFAQLELQRFERGDVIRAGDVNANFAALAAAVDELRASRAVPGRLEVAPRPAAGQYGSLDAALASLDRVVLGADQTVEIRVAAGEYEHARPLELRHRDGDRIRIVGDGATLRFTTPGDGVRVTDGRRLGLLDGVRLAGAGAGAGVAASNGAFARLGDVSIAGFARGVDARAGAVVVVETRLAVDAPGESGVSATLNATVTTAEGALAVTGGDTGVLARDGAVVQAPGARLEGCHLGANALFGGRIGLSGAVVGGATAVGLTAAYGGSLFAAGAEVRDVAEQQCLFAGPGGRIDAAGSVLSDCGAQGALALGGARILIDDAEITGTGSRAVESLDGSVVNADRVTARDTDGFLAHKTAFISAVGARSLDGRGDAFRAGDVSAIAADGAEAARNAGAGFAAYRGGVVHAPRSVVQANGACHFAASSYGHVYSSQAEVRGCMDCCVQGCEVGSTVCSPSR